MRGLSTLRLSLVQTLVILGTWFAAAPTFREAPLAAPLGAVMQGGGCTAASFMLPADSPVGAGEAPEMVAVGDFNLDGKPDLAAANTFSGDVTILLGKGLGGFTQPAGSPVSAGFSPFGVAIGDFDLDKKSDLAVANSLSNNVTILLNACAPNVASAGAVVWISSGSRFGTRTTPAPSSTKTRWERPTTAIQPLGSVAGTLSFTSDG